MTPIKHRIGLGHFGIVLAMLLLILGSCGNNTTALRGTSADIQDLSNQISPTSFTNPGSGEGQVYDTSLPKMVVAALKKATDPKLEAGQADQALEKGKEFQFKTSAPGLNSVIKNNFPASSRSVLQIRKPQDQETDYHIVVSPDEDNGVQYFLAKKAYDLNTGKEILVRVLLERMEEYLIVAEKQQSYTELYYAEDPGDYLNIVIEEDGTYLIRLKESKDATDYKKSGLVSTFISPE